MTEDSAELGHVQLEVDDLERSVAFYRRYLGLEVSERMESRKGRVVLLSGGDRHREVALRAATPPALAGYDSADPGASAGDGADEGAAAEDRTDPAEAAGRSARGGLATGGALSAPFQVGFELPDRQALAELFFELRTSEIPTTAVDHGVSWSLYFRDPDGNALEAYWDTRAEEDGRDRWGGRSRLLSVEQILPDERVRELAERLRERAEEDEAEEEEQAEEVSGEEQAGGEAAAEAEGSDAEAPASDPAEERPATSD